MHRNNRENKKTYWNIAWESNARLKGKDERINDIEKQLLACSFFFFLKKKKKRPILLSHGQLWAITEGSVSLPR